MRGREEMVGQALTALHLYRRDQHYVVADGKVQIVDESTGRVMPDRSWERGLHQMIEVKEGVEPTPRRDTLARLTYQRLFRRYLLLSGMTGTAAEAAREIRSVYGLDVARVPLHRPSRPDAAGGATFCLDAGREVGARGRRRRRLALRRGPAGADRHALGAGVGAGQRGAGAARRRACAAQRPAGRGRSAGHRAGRPGRAASRWRPTWPGAAPTSRSARAVEAAGGLHVILTEYHDSRAHRPPAVRPCRAPGRPRQLRGDRVAGRRCF